VDLGGKTPPWLNSRRGHRQRQKSNRRPRTQNANGFQTISQCRYRSKCFSAILTGSFVDSLSPNAKSGNSSNVSQGPDTPGSKENLWPPADAAKLFSSHKIAMPGEGIHVA
jgi:hypothetical protein